MKKNPRAVLLALSLAASPASALVGDGFSGAWKAEGTHAANPPLPLLRFEPGAWRVKVAPAYYFGKPTYEPAGFTTSGRFSGLGVGVAASYAFTSRWGAYFWMLGSRGTGNVTYTPKAGSGQWLTELSGLKTGTELISAGAMFQLLADDSKYSLPVFAGPVMARVSGKQTLRRFDATGALRDDFDVSLDHAHFGVAAGAQAAVPLGKRFELNPFLLAATYFTDACDTYSVTRQGVDSGAGMSSISSRSCGGTRRLESGDEGVVAAGGVNLSYVPWNFSVSLTAPFLASVISDEDADVTLLTFSWSFGSKKPE